MTDTSDIADGAGAPKKSVLGLVIGGAALLAGSVGGFYLATSGYVKIGAPDTREAEKTDELPSPRAVATSFVPLEPLLVSLTGDSRHSHLRFQAQLQVKETYAGEVEAIKPRILDVLNTYLQAVNVADIVAPAALMRLRAQMLRRVQIITGPGKVEDLLVMEFVLN